MPINRKHAVKNSFLSLRALFIGGFRFLFIALNFYVNDILHQNNANEKKILRAFKSWVFNTIGGGRIFKVFIFSSYVSFSQHCLFVKKNVKYEGNVFVLFIISL